MILVALGEGLSLLERALLGLRAEGEGDAQGLSSGVALGVAGVSAALAPRLSPRCALGA